MDINPKTYVPTWRAEPLPERLRRACDLLEQHRLLTEWQAQAIRWELSPQSTEEEKT